MGQLVEGALDAEVGVEGQREDARVRGDVAPGVVADQQHRARRRGCCPARAPRRGTRCWPAATAAAAARGCSPGRARRGRRGGSALRLVGHSLQRAGEQRAGLGRRSAGSASSASAVAVAARSSALASLPSARRSRRRRRSGRRWPRAPRARERARRRRRVVARAKNCSSRSLVSSGRSTWGTWPQESSVTCSALGSHLRDVAAERGRDRAGRACPRRTAPAARARPAGDRSRCGRTALRGRCCAPRRGRRSGRRPSGKCAGTRRPSGRRRAGSTASRSPNMLQNCEATIARGTAWGSRPNSGRSSRTIGWNPRLIQATAGHSSASPPTRSGALRPTSIATRPPIELPTMWARSMPSSSISPSMLSAYQRAL